MLTPIPTRVDDPKDAVLWSVYSRLQEIDENQGTRLNFATTIAFNSHTGLNDKVFKFELDQLRQILGIVEPKQDDDAPVDKIREFEEATTATTMRDDL
jgi:hypothetical protein